MSFFKRKDKTPTGALEAKDEDNESDREDAVSYKSSMNGSLISINGSTYGDIDSDPDFELRALQYYHGFLPRSDAEEILTQPGDYLLRKTESNGVTSLVISIGVAQNEYVHLAIPKNPKNGQWVVNSSVEVANIDAYLTQMVNTKTPLASNDPRSVIRHLIVRQGWQLRHNQIIREKKVGEGAFGEVFKGWLKIDDDRPLCVAIKCLKSDTLVTREQRDEFIAEARICKKLHYPNIIKFRGIAIDEQPLMMVLEWADGGSLLDVLKKMGSSMEPATKSLYCVQAAQGMRYLEKNKIVHRDVASRNCLIGEGRVKIADFGLSLMSTELKKVNLENTIVPIRWLAPETLKSFVFSHKTDVWSFGVMIWEVFANGKLPFADLTLRQVAEGIKTGMTLHPTRDMPDGMVKVMQSCFEQDQERRPTFLQLKLKLRKEYDSQTGRKKGLFGLFKKKEY